VKNKMVSKKQRGFAVVGFMVFIMMFTFFGIYQANQWRASVEDSAALSTGKYMLTVRGAVLDALSRHQDVFSLTDTTSAPAGTYPVAPAWATFTGDVATISVQDLKTSGFLNGDFPAAPPLGRSLQIRFIRTPGLCPGVGCAVEAYIFTCWPISKLTMKTAFDASTCPASPGNLEFSQNLIGKVMEGAESYGGSNSIDPSRIRGSLFNKASVDLGIPANSPGHVAVVASLNSTMFNQFVRQGDTRHIYLNDDLTVAGRISTGTGLLITTKVVIGETCADEGMYATTSRQSWAMCSGGRWFELTNHVVMSTQYLANGAAVTEPACPGANMESFSYASIQRLDTTMTGSDVNVRGDLNGGVTGTGVVNQSGNVSVTGSFAGKVVSSPESSIRVAQRAEVVGGQVVITPASADSRAMVIQGCRYHG